MQGWFSERLPWAYQIKETKDKANRAVMATSKIIYNNCKIDWDKKMKLWNTFSYKAPIWCLYNCNQLKLVKSKFLKRCIGVPVNT